jgi:hypothetical protein
MKITFLGTGSAFAMENFQTNFLIERNEKKRPIRSGSLNSLWMKIWCLTGQGIWI